MVENIENHITQEMRSITTLTASALANSEVGTSATITAQPNSK